MKRVEVIFRKQAHFFLFFGVGPGLLYIIMMFVHDRMDSLETLADNTPQGVVKEGVGSIKTLIMGCLALESNSQ